MNPSVASVTKGHDILLSNMNAVKEIWFKRRRKKEVLWWAVFCFFQSQSASAGQLMVWEFVTDQDRIQDKCSVFKRLAEGIPVRLQESPEGDPAITIEEFHRSRTYTVTQAKHTTSPSCSICKWGEVSLRDCDKVRQDRWGRWTGRRRVAALRLHR